MAKKTVVEHEFADDTAELEQLTRELVELQESGALDDASDTPSLESTDARRADAAWQRLKSEREDVQSLRRACVASFRDANTLGNLLNSARHRAGLDLERTANLLRVNRETMTLLEAQRDLMTVPVVQLARIMEVLDLTVSQLESFIGKTDERPPPAEWRSNLQRILKRWGRID